MTDTANEPLTAGPGRKVTLTFSLSLANGQLIDRIDEPATLTWGDESILPGFQELLEGCKAGDRKTLFVQAKDAFGDINPDNIQYFKPEQLKEMGLKPEIGMMINFNDDHRISMGHEQVAGVVTSIDSEWITLDFNHPLAGQDLNIQFEIFSIEKAPETAPEPELSLDEKLGPMSLVNPKDADNLQQEHPGAPLTRKPTNSR